MQFLRDDIETATLDAVRKMRAKSGVNIARRIVKLSGSGVNVNVNVSFGVG